MNLTIAIFISQFLLYAPPVLQLISIPVFGMESPLGLFPPGLEHKMYPLMDVEHRAPPLDAQLFTNVKKKCKLIVK